MQTIGNKGLSKIDSLKIVQPSRGSWIKMDRMIPDFIHSIGTY